MNQSPISDNELFTLQLPSQLESITQIESLVEELCTRYNVSDDIFANMMTCLNEAANNAIVHGNKLDPEKKIYVNAEVTEHRRLIWTITDEGSGFDYSTLPDPTSPENKENLTGRGVFIIKQLADQCVFNPKGNTLELHFKI